MYLLILRHKYNIYYNIKGHTQSKYFHFKGILLYILIFIYTVEENDIIITAYENFKLCMTLFLKIQFKLKIYN